MVSGDPFMLSHPNIFIDLPPLIQTQHVTLVSGKMGILKLHGSLILFLQKASFYPLKNKERLWYFFRMYRWHWMLQPHFLFW